VDEIILEITSWFGGAKDLDEAMEPFRKTVEA
jgi:hypothetical protein